MRTGQHKSLLSLVTVLLYLLFGALGQSGMVLCLEEDGRLKLEASRIDGSCCDGDHREMDGTPVAGSLSIVRGLDSSCYHCVDLSLSLDGVQSTRQSANTRLTRLCLPLLGAPLSSSAQSAYVTHSTALSEPSSYLQSSPVSRLRTIILLI